MKFVEVGPVGMPDFTRAGYKLNKQGFGGKDFFANVSLDSRKVETSTLPKGTGIGATVDWHMGRRHLCDFTLSLRLEQDHRYAQRVEADFHKLLRRLGYKKVSVKDKKGRVSEQFVKGVNRLYVSAKMGNGRQDRNDGFVKFHLWNLNDAARKN